MQGAAVQFRHAPCQEAVRQLHGARRARGGEQSDKLQRLPAQGSRGAFDKELSIATLKITRGRSALMSASISKVTVLGSGVMGHGIAQVSAMAGYSVVLRDIEQPFLDRAMEKIRWSLNKLVEKQKLSQADSDRIFLRITPMVDLKKALAGADLLIEAVPEDMGLKKKGYSEIGSIAEQK